MATEIPNEEMPASPTRDWLHKHGNCVVRHMNYEEYELPDGQVWACGWNSPQGGYGDTPRWGGTWLIYHKNPEPDYQI